MRRESNAFTDIVRASLAATPVSERLQDAAAVILERIARGGGATNWYWCRDAGDLPLIESELSPGSVVSFYFDGRVSHGPDRERAVAAVRDKVSSLGNIVIGILADRVHIDMTVVVSVDDLVETAEAYPVSSEVFYGEFPGRDNDGLLAITVTLPDNDGVVRGHPH